MNTKSELVHKLQQDILMWQGFKPAAEGRADRIGLGAIEDAFPGGVFPKGAIHEFIAVCPEDAAASDGFIAGLLAALMNDGAASLWISTARHLFPAALSAFNVATERIIFIDVDTEKDALWVMEEALRCKGLAVVVAEVDALGLIESRRLQLAVEESGVTGFIMRKDTRRMASTIATARWQISPLPSVLEAGMPGLGFPRWQVALLKVRNGIPGSWMMEWAGTGFLEIKQALQQDDWKSGEQRQIG
ncbi:ImuA family protein [Pedobacter zeae]|uniref:Protein ImuA n=1 Tax=Pedobacter zeae TaxID=1737356 RepID=A0A7W6K998_9SPHI|nr:Error-prone repair protein ImuA [Pedobacter zeae]MBB4106606.1 protein ImuA [Pedobacter zeae]GGH02648.1 hypothetical protein GCM10007422_17260 [Pedobacter zeae]